MHSIQNLDKELVIEFELGNVCNYKCNYCFPGSNEGNKLWPDITKVTQALIKYIKAHNRKTRLYLIGGEPTLWKHLPQFCSSIKLSHDVTVNISTNASQSLRWWQTYYANFDVVNISLHHQYANVQHCIDVADFLYENNIETNIDVLMDPNHFVKCMDIVEQCKTSKNLFPIIAKTVLFDGSHRYIDDQHLKYLSQHVKRYPNMEWYNRVSKRSQTKVLLDNGKQINNDNYFIVHNLNHFKGWKCNLGVDIVKIDAFGNLKGNCGQDLKQNIYTTSTYKIEPVTCEQDVCPCSGETITSKWKQHA